VEKKDRREGTSGREPERVWPIQLHVRGRSMSGVGGGELLVGRGSALAEQEREVYVEDT